MTPAEEKARLAMVQIALENLLSGGPVTRVEMFGTTDDSASREFQRKVINSLEKEGVVYKSAGSGPFQEVKVFLKNRKKAEHMLQNPAALSKAIWSTTVPTPIPQALPSFSSLTGTKPAAPQEPSIILTVTEEKSPQEPEREKADVVVRRQPAPTQTIPQGPPAMPPTPKEETPRIMQAQAPILTPSADLAVTQQLLERLLLVMDAACQRIIYTSEQVDALAKRVEELEPKIDYLWRQLK